MFRLIPSGMYRGVELFGNWRHQVALLIEVIAIP